MSIHESEQLSEDILYLEYLIRVEKDNIKERIVARLNADAPLQIQVEAISDELSEILGQMSARISIVENFIVNGVPSDDYQLVNGNDNSDVSNEVSSNNNTCPVLVNEIKLSIVDIGLNNRLGELFHTNNNIPYHVVNGGDEISFELPICRVNKHTIAVDVVDVSTQSSLANITFYIDGHKLKHKVIEIDGVRRLICYLPISKTGNTTHVLLTMPSSHSNSSFRLSLSDVYCVPKLSIFKAIINKLKGK